MVWTPIFQDTHHTGENLYVYVRALICKDKSHLLWGTIPSVEMCLSPHLEKPVGSEVGGQDPHPWIGSPVGNQACIVP